MAILMALSCSCFFLVLVFTSKLLLLPLPYRTARVNTLTAAKELNYKRGIIWKQGTPFCKGALGQFFHG